MSGERERKGKKYRRYFQVLEHRVGAEKELCIQFFSWIFRHVHTRS
jgi:hypothetical protein